MPFSSVPVLLKDAKCIGIYFFWEPCYPFKNSYTLPIWCNEKKFIILHVGISSWVSNNYLYLLS